MKKFCVCALLLSVLATADGWAQDSPSTPDGTRKHATDTMEYYNLQRKMETEGLRGTQPEEGAEADFPEGPSPDETIGARRLLVQSIEIGPSRVLTDAELEAITRKYEGRELTVADLFAVVAEINALYKSKNFLAAKAILPPQKVKAGVVAIQLVEGQIGEVRVSGNAHTRSAFVTRRISLKSGDLVDLERLKRDILFINRVYDIQLRSELTAGSTFGSTDCILKVEEPPNYQATLFADNAGREDVGRERLGLVLRNNSLLGYRDALILGGHVADGTTAGFAHYSFPLNRFGTQFGLAYDYNQIDIRSGPFEDLDVGGDSRDLGVSLRQPLLVRPQTRLNAFLEYHDKDTSTEFGDVTLFENRIATLVLGLDFQTFDRRGFWYTRHAGTSGLEALGGDRNFFRYNLDLSRLQIFKAGLAGIFRLSGQWADSDLLPSSEQFQVGGMSTVRGYSEGLLIGDDGYVVNLELQFEMFSKTPLREKVKGTLFVDHGGAFPYKGAGESIDNEDFLTSGGVGLLFNYSQYFSGRINWGLPFDDREGNQDWGLLHFYLQSSF